MTCLPDDNDTDPNELDPRTREGVEERIAGISGLSQLQVLQSISKLSKPPISLSQSETDALLQAVYSDAINRTFGAKYVKVGGARKSLLAKARKARELAALLGHTAIEHTAAQLAGELDARAAALPAQGRHFARAGLALAVFNLRKWGARNVPYVATDTEGDAYFQACRIALALAGWGDRDPTRAIRGARALLKSS